MSSTRIRALLSEGRIGEARTCLGTSPMLYGPIVSGDRIGRQLGFPTANLRIGRRILLPRFGVYLVKARVGELFGYGLLYVGRRPTLSGATDLRCEVHLLESPRTELLGQRMNVELLERIRADVRFSSLEALQEQIAADMEHARELVDEYARDVDPFAG